MRNIPSYEEFINEGLFGSSSHYKPKPTTIVNVSSDLYHGTSIERAKSILSSGFILGYGDGLGNINMPAVYFAQTDEAAKKFATMGKGNADFAVLKVKVEGKFIQSQQRNDIDLIKEFCDQNNIPYSYDKKPVGSYTIEFIGARLRLDWPSINAKLKQLGIDGFIFKDSMGGSTVKVWMVIDRDAIKEISPFKYRGSDPLGKLYKEKREPYSLRSLRFKEL